MDNLLIKIILIFILSLSLVLSGICYYYITLIESHNSLTPLQSMSEDLNSLKNKPNSNDRYINISFVEQYIDRVKIFLKSLINMIESSAFILCIFIVLSIFLIYYLFYRASSPPPSLFDSHNIANTYLGDDFSKHMFY